MEIQKILKKTIIISLLQQIVNDNKNVKRIIFQFSKVIFDVKFIKYIFVGILNTMIGYSIYSFCLFSKLHYSISIVIANALSVLIAFFTTGKIVFNNSNNRIIFKFFAVYGFISLLTMLILYLINIILHYHNMYIAGFVLIAPNAIISFLLMKNFVFL